MTQSTTDAGRQTERPSIVERFAYFWANPDLSLLKNSFTDDVLLYSPGEAEPRRGPEAYIAKTAEFLDLMPGLRLEVADYATNGDLTFIRWIARATGANGPIEFSGIDRLRVRNGLIAENRIVFDNALFQRLVHGKKP